METFFNDLQIFPDRLNNKEILWIVIPNEIAYRTFLREILPNARWSATHKSWYVKDAPLNRKILNYKRKVYDGRLMMAKINPINQPYFKKYNELLRLKAYSESTIKTYCAELAQFLYTLDKFPVYNFNPERLRSYLLYCIAELGLTENQIHSRLNALKFFFEQLFDWDNFYYEIPRPKKRDSLPKVFSVNEIKRLFAVTKNLKHLMILKLGYGLGLRVSEIVALKVDDIDSDRMLVLIQNSKGKKDRYVPLPTSVLNELREYYIAYKPEKFMFENNFSQPLSVRTIQVVFQQAKVKANINKKVGIHGLRHSYATHLLEYGTDMSIIQKLLGHQHVKTTEVYAKVSNTFIANIRSPLDEL